MNKYKTISILIVAVLLLFTIASATSCKKNHQNGNFSPKVTTGIGNCYGYVWWQLTGVAPNSESKITGLQELQTELIRRGYKAFTYTNTKIYTTPLRQTDVVIFEGGNIHHAGIVLSNGTLSHFRSTQIQLIQNDGSLLPHPDHFVIVDPKELAQYPGAYEKWLMAPPQNVSSDVIKKKEAERSIGFWHDSDTMDVVKSLLYPKSDPVITVWKLPVGLEIGTDMKDIHSDETLQLIAWLHYSGEDKAEVTTNLDLSKIIWRGTSGLIKNMDGLIKGSDLSPGKNEIKASITVITPWGFASDAVKSQSIGKDLTLPLESKTIELTMIPTSQKPPIFTKADMVITGLPHTMTLSDLSRVYESGQDHERSNRLYCLYTWQSTQKLKIYCSAELSIFYYFDVAYADENEANLEAALYLTPSQLATLRADPSYNVIFEEDYGPSRKTLLWIEDPNPKPINFTKYSGSRLNRVDPHYYVMVKVDGTGYSSKEELKLVVDILERHGIDVINQKKSQN